MPATRTYAAGQELPAIQRSVPAVIMFSRQWAGTNPVHWDAAMAARQGMKAPVVTGQLSAALIQMACVELLGEAMWRGSIMDVRFRRPVFLDDTLTAGGRIAEVRPEGGEQRVVIQAWVKNQKGDEVTTAQVEALTPGP